MMFGIVENVHAIAEPSLAVMFFRTCHQSSEGRSAQTTGRIRVHPSSLEHILPSCFKIAKGDFNTVGSLVSLSKHALTRSPALSVQTSIFCTRCREVRCCRWMYVVPVSLDEYRFLACLQPLPSFSSTNSPKTIFWRSETRPIMFLLFSLKALGVAFLLTSASDEEGKHRESLHSISKSLEALSVLIVILTPSTGVMSQTNADDAMF
mmetsp:Transcript_50751/g.158550  ORF Transcript_50751/g.158550 Transcript_50751/m.158550 type:complete len:207 (-) Transcript_50751:446-1066(-)